MSLVRYEPWNILNQLRREIENMYLNRSDEAHLASTREWVPAVDIHEDKEGFTINADLPGVDPDAIKVHAENSVLTIKGNRESEKKK